MTIECLFGQRICRYEGEYAPELLAAMDDVGYDENPDYLHDKEKEYRDSGEFSFLKRISIGVSQKEFDAVFFPKDVQITGTVKA